jgi:hypothetical protein
MTIEEIRKYYIDNIIWSAPPRQAGGQTCGLGDRSVICENLELNIKIQVGCCRSQLANKNLAFTLMTLAIEDQFR